MWPLTRCTTAKTVWLVKKIDVNKLHDELENLHECGIMLSVEDDKFYTKGVFSGEWESTHPTLVSLATAAIESGFMSPLYDWLNEHEETPQWVLTTLKNAI